MSLANRFTPGANCDCRCDPCIVATDLFDRPDNAAVGGRFTEVAGDGEISSEQLVSDTADSLFIHAAQFPGTGLPGFLRHPGTITTTVYSTTVGAQAHLVGSYKDTSNYLYAEWTFESGQARVKFYKLAAGVLSGSNDYVIPGLGAGVVTRLRFCWTEAGVSLSSPGHFTSLTPESTGFGALIGGDKAGLGTGDTGGDVTFDFYVAEQSEETTAGCSTCQECIGCPDDQQLCLRMSGAEDAGDCSFEEDGDTCWSTFNVDTVLERGWFLCAWQWNRTFPAPSYNIEAFMGFDDPNWVLRVYLRKSRVFPAVSSLAIFEANLGPDPPDCTNWCIPLTFVAATGALGEDHAEFFDQATATISSGPACCYYDSYGGGGDGLPPGEETCCSERAEMPGTLYATLYNPYTGNLIATDVELTIVPGGQGNWEYAGNMGSHPEGCSTGVDMFCEYIPEGEPGGPYYLTRLDYFAKNLFGTCVGATVILRVISCDPFHAVPEPAGNPDGLLDGTEVIE